MGTYSLHCSSFLGLPFRILNIELVKPRKGTTMETISRFRGCFGFRVQGHGKEGFGWVLLWVCEELRHDSSSCWFGFGVCYRGLGHSGF